MSMKYKDLLPFRILHQFLNIWIRGVSWYYLPYIGKI